MISIELIRRIPFFECFNSDQITTLASLAEDEVLKSGDNIYYVEDELKHFSLVVEGKVDIVIGIPAALKEIVYPDNIPRI